MISSIAPRELRIEITDACNLDCFYCYLGGAGHPGRRFMSEESVLRWVDWAEDNNIPCVRFTGGEATLHPQIKLFCNYALLRGRYVILNTNGMGDPGVYDSLFRVVHNVGISWPSTDAVRADALTGGHGVLARKQAVLEQALAAGMTRVCILTPLLPELHGQLESFVRIAQTSPRISWLPLRYQPTPDLPRPWSRADAQAFAEEMAVLMDRYPKEAVGIFLPMPFCGVSPTNLGARVFHGRTTDCGPFVALNVNTRGTLKACYEVGEISGHPSTLDEVRVHTELHACTLREALPDECRRCPHLVPCAGGCRKPYGLVQYKGKQIDYLAGFL